MSLTDCEYCVFSLLISRFSFNVALTVHAVKGMEFKKVYLYGMTSRMVSDSDMIAYKIELANKKESTKDSKGVGNIYYLLGSANVEKRQKAIKKVVDYSVSVEGERRNLLVTATRTIDELVVCYDEHNLCELLPELKDFPLNQTNIK